MPAGRPTVMTEIVLGKLNEAFAIGASDKEACFYADISPDTLYDYQLKNPKFIQRKEALKERPVLLARQTVLKAIESDPLTARWYLERRRKDEFSSRQELTGADGERIIPILGGASVHSDDQHSQTTETE